MPEGRKPKGSYSVGLATREAILKTASELIAEGGYHGISLRDLARQVGISHPAVIYHFPNKEALIRAVILRWEEAFGVFDVELDPDTQQLVIRGVAVDSYRDLALQLMTMVKREDADIVLGLSAVLACEATAADYPVHDYMVARRTIFLEFLTEQVKFAQEEEVFGVNMPSERVADLVITFWEGTGLQARYKVNSESALDVIASFLATCIVQLKVAPDALVEFSGQVSEDIADAYVRVMHCVHNISE